MKRIKWTERLFIWGGLTYIISLILALACSQMSDKIFAEIFAGIYLLSGFVVYPILFAQIILIKKYKLF
jgi:hypothetical protein